VSNKSEIFSDRYRHLAAEIDIVTFGISVDTLMTSKIDHCLTLKQSTFNYVD